MNRLLVATLVFVAMPFTAATAAPIDTAACISQINASFTCYAPGLGGKIEGPFATSKKGLTGVSIPATLDTVRLGTSKAVTLAAHPMHYGKYINLGTITYTSAIDGATYTMTNVVGYVHDTGCAFWENGRVEGEQKSCCAKYNTCADVYRKIDIAHGDYRTTYTKGGVFDVNNGPSCKKISKTVCQIGGPLTVAPQITSSGIAPGNDQKMSLANMQTGGLGQGITKAPGITTSPQMGGASQQTGGAAQNQQTLSSLLLQQNTQTGTAGSADILSGLSPAGFLIAQPKTVKRGAPITVSWAAIGAVSSCAVLMQTETGERQEVARVKAGTRYIATTDTSLTGKRTFTLSCITAGAPFEKTSSITIE